MGPSIGVFEKEYYVVGTTTFKHCNYQDRMVTTLVIWELNSTTLKWG